MGKIKDMADINAFSKKEKLENKKIQLFTLEDSCQPLVFRMYLILVRYNN